MNSQPTKTQVAISWQPYAALAFGIVCIATSGIFVKQAGLPGPVAAFYRTLIAVIAMAIPFAMRVRQITFSRRTVLILIAAGVMFALDAGLWSTAVQYTSVANAVLLGNTAPIWVSLGALLIFRERLQRNFWIGLALALSGAVLIVGTDFVRSPTLNAGNLLALSVSVFYASYMLITQHGRTRLDALSYSWLTTLAACCTLFVITQIAGQSLAVPAQSWPALLGLGLITHTAGWLSVNYAQGHLSASVVSPTMLGQPIVAAAMAWFFLGETLSSTQFIGGAIVLAGIYLVHHASHR